MVRRVALLVALSCLAPGAGLAQTAHLVVRSGGTVMVYKISSINPDCSYRGRTTINLTEAPSGGDVTVAERRDYVAFPPNNPRSACNRRKVSATEVFYRSSRSFVGYDKFAIESITVDGVSRSIPLSVEVR